jgi:hypothetical protein
MKVLRTAAVLCIISASVLSAADDPFAGTWTLNTAKSKYTPGPAPQSVTMRLVPSGDALSVSSDATIEGKTYNVSYTVKSDGTPATITGSPVADTVNVRRIDDRTREITSSKAGKQVGRTRVRLSADGKTLTATGTGTNVKGQPMKFTAVYDRQ